jgi:hypothetical protein
MSYVFPIRWPFTYISNEERKKMEKIYSRPPSKTYWSTITLYISAYLSISLSLVIYIYIRINAFLNCFFVFTFFNLSIYLSSLNMCQNVPSGVNLSVSNRLFSVVLTSEINTKESKIQPNYILFTSVWFFLVLEFGQLLIRQKLK